MKFRFFAIPSVDLDASQYVLSAFCSVRRIFKSQWHLVDRSIDSFCATYVTWVEGAMSPIAVGAESFVLRASGKASSVAVHRGRMNSRLQLLVADRRDVA